MHRVPTVRRTAARVLAVVSALIWTVPFFGAIDLTTVAVERGPEWRSGYLLEAGWGLLFTVLVAVPLGVLALRPGDPPATAVLTVTVAALLLAGTWAAAAPQVATGLALAADVAVVSALGGVRRPATRAPDLRLLGLAVLALVGALAYGRAALADPAVLSVTDGVDHHGVQAALALAVAGCVGLAAVVTGPLPAWCAVGCLAWLSALSLAYPDVEASLGTGGGVAGLGLAAAVAAAATAARGPVIRRREAAR